LEIAKCLTFESFRKGSNVFDWGKRKLEHNLLGSTGDKFYLILHGKVGANIPQEKLKKRVQELLNIEMMKAINNQA